MKYSFAHVGINVLHLEQSIEFYDKAFGMKEAFRMHPKSNLDMVLCFLSDGHNGTMITLVWYGERKTPYVLGENNVHIALVTDDFEASYKRHKEMGIVSIEEIQKNIYYVEDPDGYEIAIVPANYHPTFISQGYIG